MNKEVFAKRIKADMMRLEYRSALARKSESEDNVTYKILLAYSDIINDFMLDGRTFEYSYCEVEDYISSMTGAIIEEMNTCRGISHQEYINEQLQKLEQFVPEYIKDQFDQMPDEPLYNEDEFMFDDTDYDEEDEDEE